SRVMRSSRNSRPLLAAILEMHHRLHAERRSTAGRDRAAASALLTHAHSAFPSSPLLLSRAILDAKRIDAIAMPLQPLFRKFPWIARHLLAAEWTALPFRLLTRAYRRLSWSAGALRSRFRSLIKLSSGVSER